MPLLQWDSRYDIGVPSIDAQHRRLFSLFNELHDALAAGRGEQVLRDLLNGLIDYTRTHFREEERYMEAIKCPTRAEHCRAHLELTQQVQAFHAKLIQGEARLTREVMDFLTDWLVDHVQGMDQQIKAADAAPHT